MKARGVLMFWIVTLCLCGLSQFIAAQRVEAGNQPRSGSCLSANSPNAVTVHAPKSDASHLSLCDGRALGGNAAQIGQGQPLALASGDFDEDGVPDLVSGFASGKGGTITVHRGNVNALWPYGAALRNEQPPAFFPNPRVFVLQEAPDFSATGDFDADGHWDVVTAQRGSDALYFLKGDGHGGF